MICLIYLIVHHRCCKQPVSALLGEVNSFQRLKKIKKISAMWEFKFIYPLAEMDSSQSESYST